MALQQNTAEALAELIDAEIPEAMIQSEINARVQDFAARIEEQGVNVQEYLERVGKTGEELVAEFREPASNAVRIDLGLRAVADAEDLWPDDEAIDAEIEQALGDSDQEVSEVRQRLADAGQLSALRADLAKRAAVEWLTDNVELVDENGDPVDRDLLEFPEIAADEDDDSDGGADSADEDDDSDVIEVSADDSTDDSTDEDDEADGESE
jgi:trigger factor